MELSGVLALLEVDLPGAQKLSAGVLKYDQ
jgi:hypothetical protein